MCSLFSDFSDHHIFRIVTESADLQRTLDSRTLRSKSKSNPTMHQDHNIPWDIVASHLKFTVPKSGDRSKMDFYPKDRATQTSDLRHFARKFAAAITEFSRTERAKYPRSFSVVMNGRIISEDVFEPYEDAGTSPTGTLNRSSVEGEPMEYRIEDWIARARTSYEYQREPLDKNLCYSTSHAYDGSLRRSTDSSY